MATQFSKGERIRIRDEQVAAKVHTASKVGTVVQGDPDQGPDGTYQVMFDGDDLPQWVSGASLEPMK